MRSGILPLPRVGVCVIYCPRGASAESTCYPLHGRAQPAHRSTWGKGQCRSPMPGASSRFCSSLNATKANSHTPFEWRPYNATSWTPRCNACARLRPRNRGVNATLSPVVIQLLLGRRRNLSQMLDNLPMGILLLQKSVYLVAFARIQVSQVIGPLGRG